MNMSWLQTASKFIDASMGDSKILTPEQQLTKAELLRQAVRSGPDAAQNISDAQPDENNDATDAVSSSMGKDALTDIIAALFG